MKYVEAIGRAVAAWWTHPAAPWQFWWPQSGAAGGVFLGTVATLLVVYVVL